MSRRGISLFKTIAFAEHYAANCRDVSFQIFFSMPGIAGVPHRATFADPFGDILPETSSTPPITVGKLPSRRDSKGAVK
jgi:hypothetical protein